MLEKMSNELNFLRSKEPRPTVEIRGEGLDVSEVLLPVLKHYAMVNPEEKGTIYSYGTMSVNFHEPAWSEFLIVEGSDRLLKKVRQAFAGRHDVQSRFSDFLRSTQGQSILHIEGGRCWRVLDAVTWGSDEEASERHKEATPVEPVAQIDKTADADWGDSFWDEGSSEEETDAVPKRGRLRAARADARVGAIRRTIESLFGLPEGSVALCGPDRKPLRSDATVATLRKRWDVS
jgi:hypothetical protein